MDGKLRELDYKLDLVLQSSMLAMPVRSTKPRVINDLLRPMRFDIFDDTTGRDNSEDAHDEARGGGYFTHQARASATSSLTTRRGATPQRTRMTRRRGSCTAATMRDSATRSPTTQRGATPRRTRRTGRRGSSATPPMQTSAARSRMTPRGATPHRARVSWQRGSSATPNRRVSATRFPTTATTSTGMFGAARSRATKVRGAMRRAASRPPETRSSWYGRGELRRALHG